MRTLVLIIVMLAIMAGGFYFIALRDRPPVLAPPTATSQPSNTAGSHAPLARTTTERPGTSATMPVGTPNASVVGPSQNVFLESRDPRSGRITHKFRADSLEPHRDGTVGVIRPEVRFYGKDKSSIVVLEGSGGTVTTAAGGNPDDPKSIGTSTPTNGQLNDVTLRFYDEPADPTLAGNEERLLQTPATITVKIPAVRFDAVANRVQTIDCTVNGHPVPAERVPVTVRGRDFELDGEGLTLMWDDRTGRLDSLTIDRGQRLLVTDVSRFGGSSLLSWTAPTFGEQPVAFAPSASFRDIFAGIVLVDAPTTAPAKPSRDLYQAVFDRDVHVTRGGTEVAAGDAMRVALTLGESKQEPATQRSNAHRRRRSTTTATSRPAPQPVEVHWSGPLTIRPAADVPEAPTGQMVELVGKPAWVRENGSEARGAIIRVEPESGRLRIAPGNGVEAIEVRDAGGGELHSTSPLDVDRDAGTVEIAGAGSLLVPPGVKAVPDAATTHPATTAPASTQPTTVKWTRKLHVDVDQPENGPDNAPGFLRQITIEGDADVQSDMVRAQAQSLTLAFAEPAAGSAAPTKAANGSAEGFSMPAADFSRLRMINAEGAAHLMTRDANAREQSLAAEHLRLDFRPAAPTPLLTAISGEGNVALRNADGSSLDCNQLGVQLNPTANNRPQGSDPLEQVRRLSATGDVRMAQADGSRAAADRIELGGDNSARRFKLTGAPAQVATARGILHGATIEIDPVTGSVQVPGAGGFTGTGSGSIAMTWNGSMSADGSQGVCTLNEGIHVDGTDSHGTHVVTNARSAVIRFAPTTQPTTKSSRSNGSAMAKVSMDSMQSLQLVDLDNISMTSADGRRESTIETPALDIDLVAGTVVAPQAGRMMLVEHSLTGTTQPTTQAATTAPSNAATESDTTASSGTGHFGPGTLALMWQDSMNWRLRDGDLTLQGGVRLGFEKENSNDPVRLTADRLKCTLAPIEPTPHTSGRSNVDQVAQRVDLKAIDASGHVTVRSRLMSLNAGSLTYDIASDQATAMPDAQTGLEVIDANGSSQVGFSSFTWNVSTGLGEAHDVGARIRR